MPLQRKKPTRKCPGPSDAELKRVVTVVLATVDADSRPTEAEILTRILEELPGLGRRAPAERKSEVRLTNGEVLHHSSVIIHPSSGKP